MDRPYYHLNFAMTVDGRMANPDGSRLRISSKEDMARVYRLRQDLGSIMVGIKTILADDPKLTVKEGYVPSPRHLTKIVLDGHGRTPLTSRFLRSPGRSLVFTTNGPPEGWEKDLIGTSASEGLDLEVVRLPAVEGRMRIEDISKSLMERGIDKVLVEGGPTVIAHFIREGAFDRLTIYIGPMLVGGSGPSLEGENNGPGGMVRLKLSKVSRLGEGTLLEYLPIW